MVSERVYRWLLIVYPREHRRKYGALMVQLFRDRMRRDGKSFRGLTVWIHMTFDLVGAAFKEHKEGTDMRKLTKIGIALTVLLIAGGIGVGTLLAQSRGEVVLSALEVEDTKTFTSTGSDGVAEAMQRAVEDGAITQQSADDIVQAFEEGDGPAEAWRYEFGANGVAEGVRQAVQEGEISRTTADEIVRLIDERLEGGPASLSGKIFVLEDEDATTFSATGQDGVSKATRQAVDEGAIAPDAAEQIVRSFAGDGSANVWRYDGGTGGVAEAVRQAAEEGVISPRLADMILRLFDGGNTKS